MKISKNIYGKTIIDSNNKLSKNKVIISEKYKKEFFNNVSHELKTPITIILGYAQLLKEEKFSNAELYSKAVNNIEFESKRLNSIIDDLIDQAKRS